ncbi:MAG: DMT family transporter [Pseudomonadales bacterium]|nr:DMT family transporter [Pseudomonadales bacterium]
MALPRETQAILFGLGAVALWSTVATAFKLGLTFLTPIQMLWLGCLFSLGFFILARFFVSPTSLTKSACLRAGLLGLLNPLAYYLILFEAYNRLPAQIAQPLNYTWAITLAILAVPLLKQRLSLKALVGIGVSYVGVVVLVTRGATTGLDTFDAAGITLALLSTLLWSLYWLATIRMNCHPVILMLIGFAVATPIIGVLCWSTDGFPPLTLRALSVGAWVGLFEMGVTFLLWQKALSETRQVAKVGQLIFLSPFISLLLIDQILGESVHPSAIISLGLIILGVLLVNRRTVSN